MKMARFVTNHRGTVIALAVALVIVGTMLTVVMAQPGPQADDDDDGRQRRDFRGMMMMRGGGDAALAVSGDAVFLFTRNTLYKFDAQTLELVAQTELPMPQWPQRQEQ